jgi:hypothetical protein
MNVQVPGRWSTLFWSSTWVIPLLPPTVVVALVCVVRGSSDPMRFNAGMILAMGSFIGMLLVAPASSWGSP